MCSRVFFVFPDFCFPREAFESTESWPWSRPPRASRLRYADQHKCIFRVRHEAKNSPLISRQDPALSYERSRLSWLCSPFPPTLRTHVEAREYLQRLDNASFRAVHPAPSRLFIVFLRSAKRERERARASARGVMEFQGDFPCSSVDFGR